MIDIVQVNHPTAIFYKRSNLKSCKRREVRSNGSGEQKNNASFAGRGLRSVAILIIGILKTSCLLAGLLMVYCVSSGVNCSPASKVSCS
ncbi:MAG: hypothetical protein E6Z06_08355 [Clostridiales bacterium]|nr:hypothetical protein [Clostridiales bacterium]